MKHIKRKGGVAWGGGGAQQQAATNTRARRGTAQTRASKGPRAAGRRHTRNKNKEWRTAPAREAGLSDPARTKGLRTTRAREAGPFVREGKHHRQATPDNAGRTAAETTAHQQNKPSIQPAKTPRTKTRTRRHSRPHQGGATHKHGTPQQTGGHEPTQHRPRPRKHHRQQTPDDAGRTATETTANKHNKPSIQQATTPRTETRTRRHSRPHQGGATHKHGTPQQRGGGGTNTAPTPAKPTTQPQPQPTQQATTTQTKHHHHGRGAPTQHTPARGGARTNTARPTKKGATTQRSTPHHGGGARTSAAPTPARQTTQTTNTRQCRSYGGGDNSELTKPAGHPAGYNTTNGNPSTQTPHSPPRGGARTNTTRPNKGGGGGTHQHSTIPDQANKTTATTTHPTDHDNPNQAPPPQQAATNTARTSERGATHQNSTPHQGGGRRTSTARPSRGGSTHQQSTNPGQANTTDNQHPTTPAVLRRRQQRTNKTSRASSRLQHHEPKPQHADTALPTKGGATHKHGTPQQGRGHTPAQHQPRPSQQHNRDHNPPNR